MASTADDDEKEQLFQALTELVGPPVGTWKGDQWRDSQNRVYDIDRIQRIFSRECILFVGDSLQRRAADTLHQVLLQGTLEIKEPRDLFHKSKKHDRGFRSLDGPSGGCIDIDWRPSLQDIESFAQDAHNATIPYRDYTLIVVGSNIWDTVTTISARNSARNVRHATTRAIQALASTRPDTLTVWKTGGWTQDHCPLVRDENRRRRCLSDKIVAGNAQAMATIAALNNTHYAGLDWGREILPKSLGKRRLAASDNNPHHYGLAARIQFLQMLAGFLEDRRPKGYYSGALPGRLQPSLQASLDDVVLSVDFAGRSQVPLLVSMVFWALSTFLLCRKRTRRPSRPSPRVAKEPVVHATTAGLRSIQIV